MAGATVRISDRARKVLRFMAARSGMPMQAILDEAIEEYRRRSFLERANAAFLALRKDPKTWRTEQDERNAWDSTLFDDLKKE